jgi:hypothetical protein
MELEELGEPPARDDVLILDAHAEDLEIDWVDAYEH